MPFKGFNIEYPHYSVITPQSGDSFDVRCLNVGEVNELKHSFLIPSKSSSTINTIVWKAIKSKPNHINTYQDFLKNTTIKDRMALIYGIYHSTFGNNKEFTVVCSECNSEQIIRFQLNNCFKMNPYPYSEKFKKSYKIARAIENNKDQIMERILEESEKKKLEEQSKLEKNSSEVKYVEDEEKIEPKVSEPEKKEELTGEFDTHILNKVIEKELEISKVIVHIRQPSLLDELKLVETIPFTSSEHLDKLMQILIIEKFRYQDNGVWNTVDHTEDILQGYETLPIDDRNTIFNTYHTNFGQYGLTITNKWNCQSCSANNNFSLDVVQQFFRMVQVL